MKIFISWSGLHSKTIAAGLRQWLPDVIQEAEPFMSENDIGAGARWAADLAKSLETTDIGVLCLTPENISAPWLIFEAGSLAKKLENSRVIPYRFGIKAADVPFPLAQFQSIEANREGTLQLLKTLNGGREHPMEKERLERLFSRLWADMEKHLHNASREQGEKETKRTDREILEEILQNTRNHQTISFLRTAADIHDYGFEHIGDKGTYRLDVTAEVYWHEQGFSRDDALELCGALKQQGIPSRIAEHKDKRAPNSVFIGALVPAEAARLVLRAVPYTIKYIFRPDYPEEQGGSRSGLKVGIGYRSTHMEGLREANAEPLAVTQEDFNQLIEPGLSNLEFHRRLRNITGMR